VNDSDQGHGPLASRNHAPLVQFSATPGPLVIAEGRIGLCSATSQSRVARANSAEQPRTTDFAIQVHNRTTLQNAKPRLSFARIQRRRSSNPPSRCHCPVAGERSRRISFFVLRNRARRLHRAGMVLELRCIPRNNGNPGTLDGRDLTDRAENGPPTHSAKRSAHHRHRHSADRRQAHRLPCANCPSSSHAPAALRARTYSGDRTIPPASSTEENNSGIAPRFASRTDSTEISRQLATDRHGVSRIKKTKRKKNLDPWASVQVRGRWFYGRMIRLPASCGATTAASFSGNCPNRKSTNARDFGRPEVRTCARRTRKTSAVNTSESRRLE
jgi:hypothetical protein